MWAVSRTAPSIYLEYRSFQYARHLHRGSEQERVSDPLGRKPALGLSGSFGALRSQHMPEGLMRVSATTSSHVAKGPLGIGTGFFVCISEVR